MVSLDPNQGWSDRLLMWCANWGGKLWGCISPEGQVKSSLTWIGEGDASNWGMCWSLGIEESSTWIRERWRKQSRVVQVIGSSLKQAQINQGRWWGVIQALNDVPVMGPRLNKLKQGIKVKRGSLKEVKSDELILQRDWRVEDLWYWN